MVVDQEFVDHKGYNESKDDRISNDRGFWLAGYDEEAHCGDLDTLFLYNS